jgi:hypothetical protein
MDDELLLVLDRDVLGQVLRGTGQVDDLNAVVVEDPERLTQA